jgi:hypothetical protein
LVVLFALIVAGMTPPERRVGPAVEVIAPGASAASVVAVRRLLQQMRVDERLEERLRAARLSIVVVPKKTAMTDVAQFASLRGQKTFDGRLWDQVRGTGGVRLADGRTAVAIPEENILPSLGDPYPALAIAVHELAHALHDRVLTDGDRRSVQRAYRARLEAHGPFTDAYASSNAREYFAQGANAFFGRSSSPHKVGARRDAAWLYRNDRALYGALVNVFGAPPASPIRANA